MVDVGVNPEQPFENCFNNFLEILRKWNSCSRHEIVQEDNSLNLFMGIYCSLSQGTQHTKLLRKD